MLPSPSHCPGYTWLECLLLILSVWILSLSENPNSMVWGFSHSLHKHCRCWPSLCGITLCCLLQGPVRYHQCRQLSSTWPQNMHKPFNNRNWHLLLQGDSDLGGTAPAVPKATEQKICSRIGFKEQKWKRPAVFCCYSTGHRTAFPV